MTDTLFDATYRVARELGIVTEGLATGGSTTTIIDTNDLLQADNYWNGGSVWILYDSLGTGVAPQGEFGIIKASTTVDDTVTLRTALTTAPASGDKYAIGKRRYPLYTLIQKVNQALIDMGPYEIWDKTTLDGVAAQSEYSIAIAANRDVRRVYMPRSSDANDTRYKELFGWKMQKTALGTADLLVFPYQIPVGRDIYYVYSGPHPTLVKSSDKIDESVWLERLVAEGVLNCLMWRLQKVGTGEGIEDQIAYYTRPLAPGMPSRIDAIRTKYPLKLTPKMPQLLITKPTTDDGVDRFSYPGPA